MVLQRKEKCQDRVTSYLALSPCFASPTMQNRTLKSSSFLGLSGGSVLADVCRARGKSRGQSAARHQHCSSGGRGAQVPQMARQPAFFRWLLAPLVLGTPGIRGPHLGSTEACPAGGSALSRLGGRGAESSQPLPGALLHVATVVLKFPAVSFFSGLWFCQAVGSCLS